MSDDFSHMAALESRHTARKMSQLPQLQPDGRASLDETDLRIIEALRADGRAPTLELARRLGMPESTARKRVKRLLQAGIVRIVAVVSTRALGYRREVTFAMKTERAKAVAIAERLSEESAVRFVAFGVGAFDLWVNAVFKSEEDLLRFTREALDIEGLVSYECFDVLAVFKRSFDWLSDRDLPPELESSAAVHTAE
jgi:Lrp/AsnC family transcriptional regulator, regulator for asnA, asnC and gidA